ncbi:MAG: ArnT family glycosyltransferase [bacterium]
MGKETARQRLKGKKGSQRRTAHRKMAVSLPILLTLSLLFITGLLLRAHGFARPHKSSFDELLYTVMGFQLTKDMTDYSSAHLYTRLRKQGRDLPEHYGEPLFKHPPLYCYLISFVNRISDPTDPQSPMRISFPLARRNSSRVSLLLGCLTIFVVYLIGKNLYDHRVGLLAALLLTIDPIHWICSQKIWMETTLAFFVASALLFFVLGRRKPRYFILSGVCIGLASLTKFLGILTLPIILFYTLLAERKLFRRKEFTLLILFPFVLQAPWIGWNYQVYGPEFLTNMFQFGKGTTRLLEKAVRLIPPFSALLLATLLLLFTKNRSVQRAREKVRTIFTPKVVLALSALPFALFFIAYGPETVNIVKNILQWGFIPSHGRARGIFTGEPWYFYLERLVEYSPLYLFALLSPFLLRRKEKGDLLLLLSSGGLLAFFILWGAFQCRYILPAIPLLIVLSARTQIFVYDWARRARRGWLKIVIVLLCVVVSYFYIKTVWTDFAFALPNKPIYF